KVEDSYKKIINILLTILKLINTIVMTPGLHCSQADLRSSARRYNHRFAFSDMGVEGEEGFIEQPPPSCIKINGRTYHKISEGSPKWIINDPLEQNLDRRLSSAYLSSIENVIRRENTFVAHFETLGSHENQNNVLVLDCRVENREIAAEIEQDYSESRNSRAVVVWKLGANHATYIPSTNPLYQSPYINISEMNHCNLSRLNESLFGMLALKAHTEPSNGDEVDQVISARIPEDRDTREIIEIKPSVTALPIHLENQNQIVFNATSDIQQTLEKAVSPLEIYFSRPLELEDVSYSKVYEDFIKRKDSSDPYDTSKPRSSSSLQTVQRGNGTGPVEQEIRNKQSIAALLRELKSQFILMGSTLSQFGLPDVPIIDSSELDLHRTELEDEIEEDRRFVEENSQPLSPEQKDFF
ncbi:hypothetical protein BB560_005900, partial [Smittium megazygosporum]